MSDNNMLFMQVDELDEDGNSVAEIATSKYLTFYADSLLFGVSAEHVVEIITNHTITKLPMVPDYVRGIINLRGQIIPIIDIRLRLGKEPMDSSCVIVLTIENMQLGILIDSVSQMIDIPVGGILPMPARSSQKLVCGMCSLPGDDACTVLAFDCLQLLQDA